MSLPTLTDLKIHLNITSTSNDDELVGKLDAAIANVEKLIGPITNGSVTETHHGAYGSTLLLRRMPVASVTAVSGRSYGVGAFTSLTVGDYAVDPAAGVLRVANGGLFYGDYTVTYSTGRADVSPDIAEAILIIAAHLWETQRGTAPTALALQQQDGFTDPSSFGAGFAIPNRATELLAPYVRPVIA